ncbi:MAG: cobyrinate a,c-diamide synthase [Roseburia sp.]
MKIPRIMLAAPCSGSGKTLLTCGLLTLLLDMGKNPCAFKCGPDYIDPMFHRKVIGIPSQNLDSYFSTKEQLHRLLAEGAVGDVALLEGVMGLYDGLGGTEETASTYEVASLTDTPVILVVDANGMGRTILPLLSGMKSYDKKDLIRGVILNKVSGMFYPSMKHMIQQELDLPVLGYLPKQADFVMESRHLGLVLPEEMEELLTQLHHVADTLRETLDLSRLLAIAESAPELADVDALAGESRSPSCTIAVAKDEAFCFYYEENLRMLQQAGAELVYFSPIRDKALPEHTDGILLGGGYPELHLRELSENTAMHQALRAVFAQGMPIVAECGGFMYLHEGIYDERGTYYPMVGLQKGTCEKKDRLVRFGYVELTAGEGESFLPAKGQIRGHEFHYYDSRDNGALCRVKKPVGSKSWQAIHGDSTHWWGFPHLYYGSNPEFVRRFVAACNGKFS